MDNKDKNYYKRYISVSIVILCILYVTLFSREESLVHKINYIPLWSLFEWIYGGSDYGTSFLLNVLLFIPFGYCLSGIIQNKRRSRWVVVTVVICFTISSIIESLQYLTYRGLCDVDDLISNTLGGWLGTCLFRAVGRRKTLMSTIMEIALMSIGVIGTFVTVFHSGSVVTGTYERQLAFDVCSVETVDGTTVLNGYCYLYEGNTPKYQIILKSGEHSYLADTVNNGRGFRAEVEVPNDVKYEIDAVFKSRIVVDTKTYILNNAVEYTSETTDLSLPSDLKEIVNNGVLKVYNKDYDVYVFQCDTVLYWVVGKELSQNTEIICHLYTSELDKLPENRRINGFDNVGFNAGYHESKQIGKYIVYSIELPTEYTITAICTGFNIDGDINWLEYFRPLT